MIRLCLFLSKTHPGVHRLNPFFPNSKIRLKVGFKIGGAIMKQRVGDKDKEPMLAYYTDDGDCGISHEHIGRAGHGGKKTNRGC